MLNARNQNSPPRDHRPVDWWCQLPRDQVADRCARILRTKPAPLLVLAVMFDRPELLHAPDPAEDPDDLKFYRDLMINDTAESMVREYRRRRGRAKPLRWWAG